MQKNQQAGADLVLENRQVLGIFFGIAALCGVFFALGYIIGRNTLRPSSAGLQQEVANTDTSYKPSAMPPPAYINHPTADAGTPAATPDGAPNLDFDQRVQDKSPDASLTPPAAAAPVAQPPASSGTGMAATSAPPASQQSPPPPAASPAAAPAPQQPAGIMVQVSALTRREDADALVALLKDRKLPVLITNSPSDPFFHVVVGPYQNDKDAQDAKTLLEHDGSPHYQALNF